MDTSTVARLETPGEPKALYAMFTLPLFGFLAAIIVVPHSKRARVTMLLAGILIVLVLGVRLGCGTRSPNGGGNGGGGGGGGGSHSRVFTVVAHAKSGTLDQYAETKLTVTW